MKVALLASVLFTGLSKPKQRHPLIAAEDVVSFSMHTSRSWKHDCGKRIPHRFSLLQVNKSANPGAGMDKNDIDPFDKVLKDGFMLVDCVKDAMYEAGDKFGDNRHNYKMGDVAGVSIVRYADHVPKEDRKPMTHAVCFDFCRTIPDMLFFGISNGRDCYCTPYYKAMASDSSSCDASCLGKSSEMCGGKVKNSMFSMHMCATTEEDLTTQEENTRDLKSDLKSLSEDMEELAEEGESAADTMQKSLGQVGDPAGSGLMQEAKKWAGKLLKRSKDGLDFVGQLDDLLSKVDDIGDDFADFKNVKKAESLTVAMRRASRKGDDLYDELKETYNLVDPELDDTDDDDDRIADSAKQYMRIMHFVDKKFSDNDIPSTCGGDLINKPIFGRSKNACAAACDAQVGSCVGFSFFDDDSTSLCFLFSKFESVQYYSGCKEDGFLQASQKRGGSFEANCYAKTATFEGTTLKPDPEGKCKQCLKEATNAKRCFE
jgi:hypothetical protein